MCKLNKAEKDEEKFATANVLQILRDSPYIGGFQVEIVYADKSTERKGERCYSKSSADLARFSLYWRIPSRDCLRRRGGCYSKSFTHLANSPFIGGFKAEIVYADKSTERRGGGC